MMNGIDVSPQSSHHHRVSMSDQEEKERRYSIQAILKDPNLSPHERRKSIQSLMDGRRRSSVAQHNVDSKRVSLESDMAMAAAFVASAFDDDERSCNSNSSSSPRMASKKRSSPKLTLESPSQSPGKEQLSKRQTSLRQSFTMGFGSMGVAEGPADTAADTFVESSRRMEKSRPPCGHYQRNCSIVSPCCGLVFGCRICHNDSPYLPPPFPSLGEANPAASAKDSAVCDTTKARRNSSLSSDDESHHEIDRFGIKEVICRECFTRQSSKTNNCINCGVQFGEYHCSKCNIWMSNSEKPYHCEQCGFCRVGGRDNFTHCNDCGMCIDALLFDEHNCKFGKYMSNCPVCQEDLFSSRMASHEMPCGHAIHWHCFRELSSYDIRCPVCKKTAETPDQMEDMWNTMAMEIALQPVPAELARVVDILCNDCDEKCVNQRWHFLGVQCQRCSSFNTTVEKTILSGQEAHDFLGPLTNSFIAGQSHLMPNMVVDPNELNSLVGDEELRSDEQI